MSIYLQNAGWFHNMIIYFAGLVLSMIDTSFLFETQNFTQPCLWDTRSDQRAIKFLFRPVVKIKFYEILFENRDPFLRKIYVFHRILTQKYG